MDNDDLFNDPDMENFFGDDYKESDEGDDAQLDNTTEYMHMEDGAMSSLAAEGISEDNVRRIRVPRDQHCTVEGGGISRKIALLRLPPNFGLSLEPSNYPNKVPTKQRGEKSLIRWRIREPHVQEPISTLQHYDNMSKLDSNTHLIEWSDGSYTLSIDGVQLDCRAMRDKTYIFEERQENISFLYSLMRQRYACHTFPQMNSNLSRNRTTSSKLLTHAKVKTTKLTTTTSAEEMHRNSNVNREIQAIRKRQEKQKQRVMTTRFLEGSDSDSTH